MKHKSWPFAFGTLIAASALSGCLRLNLPIEASGEAPRAFAQKQIRYMGPGELIDLMQAVFPVRDIQYISGDCTSLTPANRGLVGDIMPSTGSPIFDHPTDNFVNWYAGCLNARLSFMKLESHEIYYGASLSTALKEYEYTFATPFRELPAELRRTMVLEHIEHVIGPSDIVADFGWFADSGALADHVLALIERNEAMTVEEAAGRSLYLLALRDEFLSY